jgi:hypothetical protein
LDNSGLWIGPIADPIKRVCPDLLDPWQSPPTRPVAGEDADAPAFRGQPRYNGTDHLGENVPRQNKIVLGGS